LIALGSGVQSALEAAQILEDQGISVAVLNARFVKPLDVALLDRLSRTHNALLTVEEHSLAGGFGSAVLEALSERGAALPVKRLGIPDTFVSHATQAAQRAACGLDAAGIVAAVEDVARRAQLGEAYHVARRAQLGEIGVDPEGRRPQVPS